MAHPLLVLAPGTEPWMLLVLALIQGVSEFLPISSDGHLTLAQHLMGFEGANLAVDVALHVGTLAAVLVVFRRDLAEILRRFTGGEWREPLLLILGSVPAAAVGLGLKDHIEPLFASGRAAAAGLLVTAVFLTLGERARRRAALAGEAAGRPLGWKDALVIGSAQALAILPGVSRSGSTIATALLRGTDATAAARFSFLLSIPAVAGAVLLEVPDLVRDGGFGRDMALAVVLTFVVGVLALRVLLAWLGRGAFRWCALYCAGVGVLGLVLL